MFAAHNPAPSGFHPDHLDLAIPQKRMEQPDGIAPAPDTGDEIIRQLPLRSQNLFPCFFPDNRLKITNHHGIGMRP